VELVESVVELAPNRP